MRTKQVTVYTLAELKGAKPEAYARVLARWERLSDEDGPSWGAETMDSLKAVVAACGARLTDWSIGAYSYSSLKVECDDETEDGKAKDAEWLRVNVLKPNGYVKANGHADFPGHCKWTGYCADDDMIEAVWKSMKDGASLSDALEGLAEVARRHMEDDAEQMRSEESMECNWGDREFLEDGRFAD